MSQGFKSTKPATNDALESSPVRVNQVAVATHHSGAIAPSDPQEGWTWLDVSNPVSYNLKQYIGGVWLIILQNLQGGAPTQGGASKYTHTQALASLSWTINHALSSSTVAVSCFDATGLQVFPDTVQVSSGSQIVLTWLIAQAGTAIVIG